MRKTMLFVVSHSATHLLRHPWQPARLIAQKPCVWSENWPFCRHWPLRMTSEFLPMYQVILRYKSFTWQIHCVYIYICVCVYVYTYVYAYITSLWPPSKELPRARRTAVGNSSAVKCDTSWLRPGRLKVPLGDGSPTMFNVNPGFC